MSRHAVVSGKAWDQVYPRRGKRAHLRHSARMRKRTITSPQKSVCQRSHNPSTYHTAGKRGTRPEALSISARTGPCVRSETSAGRGKSHHGHQGHACDRHIGNVKRAKVELTRGGDQLTPPVRGKLCARRRQRGSRGERWQSRRRQDIEKVVLRKT